MDPHQPGPSRSDDPGPSGPPDARFRRAPLQPKVHGVRHHPDDALAFAQIAVVVFGVAMGIVSVGLLGIALLALFTEISLLLPGFLVAVAVFGIAATIIAFRQPLAHVVGWGAVDASPARGFVAIGIAMFGLMLVTAVVVVIFGAVAVQLGVGANRGSSITIDLPGAGWMVLFGLWGLAVIGLSRPLAQMWPGGAR